MTVCQSTGPGESVAEIASQGVRPTTRLSESAFFQRFSEGLGVISCLSKGPEDLQECAAQFHPRGRNPSP